LKALKIYSEVILQQRKDYKEDFKQAQEFIIWIVGFSVGGLYLLFSNIEKTQIEFGHCLLKLFIIFLTTSITFGAIYRLSITVYREYLRRASFYLEGAFSAENVMPVNGKDISSETDIKIVVNKIKEDFGEDMSALLGNYSELDISAQHVVLASLKDHYKKLAEWAQKYYDFALEYVKTVFKNAFGMTEKVLIK
jgi:hypothetical protein